MLRMNAHLSAMRPREDGAPGRRKRGSIGLGLTAVEEAGGEEDDGDHKGQAGVKDVVEAEAEEAVGQPRCKAQEPYPRCLSHHAHAPERGRGQGRTGAVRWPLFYTK